MITCMISPPTATLRDQLIAGYRREAPMPAAPFFRLCAAQEAAFRHRHPGQEDYAATFGFPLRQLWAGPKPRRDRPDWDRWYADAPLARGATIDCWGVGHEPGSAAAHHMTRMRHPLAGIGQERDLDGYPWPDWDGADEAPIVDFVAACRRDGVAALGTMACTVWETAWYLRSMERLMQDMADDAPLAHRILDQVTGLACVRAARYARLGCDIIELGDDIGTQRGPLLSPAMWRRWLKPRLAQVVAAARAAGPRVLIQYHSCGQVLAFVDELIEIGVDILNPVQPECMPFAEVVRRWGGRLSFNGTLGTQTVLPFGSADQVRATVREHRRLAGPCGGLLCCPTHLVEPEVPWANLEAYLEAAAETC